MEIVGTVTEIFLFKDTRFVIGATVDSGELDLVDCAGDFRISS